MRPNYSPAKLNNLQEEAHVWLVVPENITNKSIIAEFFSILSLEEIHKHNRFHFPEDRHRYLVSHAFLRKILSQYLNQQPGDLKFYYSENGKPEVSLSKNDPLIRFNLSHTAGLTACIVTINDDCGIDAEAIVHKTASLDVARLMFSDSEFKFIENLSGRTYLEEFFTRWTLREAYVKALGLGIDYPTNKLLFKIVDDKNISVAIEKANDTICQFWQFRTMQPTSNHTVSIAIKNKNKVQKSIICSWFRKISGSLHNGEILNRSD